MAGGLALVFVGTLLATQILAGSALERLKLAQ